MFCWNLIRLYFPHLLNKYRLECIKMFCKRIVWMFHLKFLYEAFKIIANRLMPNFIFVYNYTHGNRCISKHVTFKAAVRQCTIRQATLIWINIFHIKCNRINQPQSCCTKGHIVTTQCSVEKSCYIKIRRLSLMIIGRHNI